MRITTTEPTIGQFVAMWGYNGSLWSENLRVVNGVREIFIESSDFNEFGDEWVADYANYPPDTEITFYQI